MRALVVLVSVLVVALMPPISAQAQTGRINGPYVGCLTREALNEIQIASANSDRRQFDAMINTVCFLIEGREYSVVETGMLVYRIRVYAGGGSLVLYVPREAVRG